MLATIASTCRYDLNFQIYLFLFDITNTKYARKLRSHGFLSIQLLSFFFAVEILTNQHLAEK